VVAACGTALGAEHARLLRRWCRRVILFLDGDRAGREAARRSLSVVLKEGLGVRIALAGEGRDPDDLARSEGAEGLFAALGKAREFPEFLAEEASSLYDLASVDGRVAASQWALDHLVLLPSALARAEAADRVADALGIQDEVMRAELSRAARAQRRRLASEVASTGSSSSSRPALRPAEATLVRFVVACVTGHAGSPQRGREILDGVPSEALSPAARSLLAGCQKRLREDDAIASLDRLCEELPGPESQQLLELAFGQETAPEAGEAESAVLALQIGLLRGRLKDIQRRIAQTEDGREQDRLLRDKLATAREIQALEVGASPLSSQTLAGGE
jgi:DNA primase